MTKLSQDKSHASDGHRPSDVRATNNWAAPLDLIRTALGLVGAQAVTVLAGIAIALLLASGLGVDGYGKYIFALAIMQFLLLPLDFGMTTLVTRQVAVYRAREQWGALRGLLSWSLLVECLVFCAIAVVVVACLYIWLDTEKLPRETRILYLLAVTLAAVMALMRLASAVLRGLERVIWGSLPDQVIRPLVLLALIITFAALFELSASWAVALHVLAAGVGLSWAVTKLRKCEIFPETALRRPPEFAHGDWLRSLLPMGLIVGAGVINSRIDIVMLGLLSTPGEVGIYGLAIQIAGLAAMGQTLADTMASPRIAALHAKNATGEIQSLASCAAVFAFASAACVSIVILLFGGQLLSFAVGDGFGETIPIALVVTLGFLLVAFLGPITPLLLMTGHEKLMSRAMWASALLNVVLNYLLIPNYGAYGAALATLAARVFVGGYLWLYVLRLVGIKSDTGHAISSWLAFATGRLANK